VLDDSFRPHDPKYFSTVQLKTRYDPEAKCPRWMEFLHSSLDEPEIHLLQEIFGYCLVPITKAQKSFLLCGMPEVGKSKILGVLQELLLGAENVSNIPLQNLTDRFQPAELFGKMANIYADLPDKKIDDVGMFKASTGEDYITGERKHKDPFTFKPYARFVYSCNDLPPNYGDRSDAFYRRIIIIRFSKPVPKEKKDLNLMDKLALEADGILTWAIAGLKRLIAQQYQFSETERTKAETQRYKIKNNNALAFVEECCVIEPGVISYRKDMHNRYKEFCTESGLGKAMGEGSFNENVCKADPAIIEMTKEPITRRAIFKGVRLME
jgi:putative DNA primase/helicase